MLCHVNKLADIDQIKNSRSSFGYLFCFKLCNKILTHLSHFRLQSVHPIPNLESSPYRIEKLADVHFATISQWAKQKDCHYLICIWVHCMSQSIFI